MLRLLQEENDDLVRFCEKDVYGTRLSAYYSTYQTAYPFASFYLQENETNITAAVCKIDGVITICCGKNADYDELAEFLQAVGFEKLLCDAAVCDKVKLTPAAKGSVVEFAGSQKPQEEPDIRCVNRFELSGLYDILKRSNFDGLGERPAWLSDVSFRVKSGTARAAVAENSGEMVACAMVLFETEHAALIGAVATLPAFRGKGFAGTLVTSLAAQMKGSGKRTELLCAQGSIIDFYSSLGFVKTGEWVTV